MQSAKIQKGIKKLKYAVILSYQRNWRLSLKTQPVNDENGTKIYRKPN